VACPWQVLATSRQDYSEAAAAIGVEFFADVDDFCEEHPDVVVLATSILSLEAVVRSLPVQRLRRNTLFVDVLSVKEFPKRLLLSLLPAEVWCIFPSADTVCFTTVAFQHKCRTRADYPCALPVWYCILARSLNSGYRCMADRDTSCSRAAVVNQSVLMLQVDILCTHPMFGPDSGRGSWANLNLMYERVRIGHGEGRRRRADLFLQVRVVLLPRRED